MAERDELDERFSKLELSQWLSLPMTRMFRQKLVDRFDYHLALLGAEPNKSVDQLKGRAEVIDLVLHPHKLFDD